MDLLDDASFVAAGRELADRDPEMAAIVAEHGIPDFWHRPPGFATLALLIVEQQVSLASARAVFERLVRSLGGVSPETVARAGAGVLAAAGLTRQKQRYLVDLAGAILTAELDLETVDRAPDESAREMLLSRRGIGPWTADVYLLSALRRPDIWPVGDRALQVGAGERFASGLVPSTDELAELGERWRPFRSVAARLIWHDYLQRRGRRETQFTGLIATFPDSARPQD